MELYTKRHGRLSAAELVVADRSLSDEIGRRRWYHIMDLGNGIVTPGRRDFTPLWDNIRSARDHLDYQGKAVLDLGSWDGMWAFEAEALGASLVVATDCQNGRHGPWYDGDRNVLLLREALYSDVIPFWNVSPSSLKPKLDGIMYSHQELRGGFDIVQHLGVLYHLPNPLLSLAQCRSVLKEGGTLLLETAFWDSNVSAMRFNKTADLFYKDYTTWWAPTPQCLRDMLAACWFEVIDASIGQFRGSHGDIHRVSLLARALPVRDGLESHYLFDPSFDNGFVTGVVAAPRPPTVEEMESADT